MLPGLPERNPGLELANAVSVTDQEFPHSRYRKVVLTSSAAPIAIRWANCISTPCSWQRSIAASLWAHYARRGRLGTVGSDGSGIHRAIGRPGPRSGWYSKRISLRGTRSVGSSTLLVNQRPYQHSQKRHAAIVVERVEVQAEFDVPVVLCDVFFVKHLRR
jgi:hypothetical protein